MSEQSDELKKRTAEFARRIIVLGVKIPDTPAGRTLKAQLTDAGTSVAGNYRATCRSRSHAEFTAKVGQVAEEADECVGWLELLVASNLLGPEDVGWELDEARQLTKIFAKSFRTARTNARKSTNSRKSTNRR